MHTCTDTGTLFVRYFVALKPLFIFFLASCNSTSVPTNEVSQPDSPRASCTMNGNPSAFRHCVNKSVKLSDTSLKSKLSFLTKPSFLQISERYILFPNLS